MSALANLAELLARAAAEHPDRTALVEAGPGRRTTWAELDAEADRVAAGLGSLGVVAGFRVLLALGNRREFVACYLGALRAGLVVVPVNPRSTTGELVRMTADSGARVVVADRSTLTSVRQCVAGLEDALQGADDAARRGASVPRVVVVDAPAVPGETSYDALLAAGGTRAPVPQDVEALAVLLYTSGTSGKPRAAMLTHRALLANVEQSARVEPPLVGPDDVVLGVMPLFHVYGLNAVLGQVLRRGATLVLVERLPPEDTLALVDDEAVSVLPVAPALLHAWRADPDQRDRLGSARLVMSGSAPLAPELVAELEDRAGVPVHQGYGLTEASPAVTSTRCSQTVKPGSVGAPLPGIEVRLRHEGGHEPPGEDPGEIEIRGDNLFSGYWPEGDDGPDADGWWATGDVGFVDADGDLFLVDRVRELVIVSGFNVYPVEVEDVIGELDEVAEVAVIGAPDETTGERVVATVVPAPGCRLAEDELVRRVLTHCDERLARFKQPSTVHVVEDLPHTVTGKVAKGRLRAAERRRVLGLVE